MPRSLLYFRTRPLITLKAVYMGTIKQEQDGPLSGRRHHAAIAVIRSDNGYYTCAKNKLSGAHCVKN